MKKFIIAVFTSMTLSIASYAQSNTGNGFISLKSHVATMGSDGSGVRDFDDGVEHGNGVVLNCFDGIIGSAISKGGHGPGNGIFGGGGPGNGISKGNDAFDIVLELGDRVGNGISEGEKVGNGFLVERGHMFETS